MAHKTTDAPPTTAPMMTLESCADSAAAVPKTAAASLAPSARSGPTERFGTGQALKASDPGGVLEAPGHGKQVDSAVAATAVEYLLVAQSLQFQDPCPDLYFPLTHCVQVPPAGPA